MRPMMRCVKYRECSDDGKFNLLTRFSTFSFQIIILLLNVMSGELHPVPAFLSFSSLTMAHEILRYQGSRHIYLLISFRVSSTMVNIVWSGIRIPVATTFWGVY